MFENYFISYLGLETHWVNTESKFIRAVQIHIDGRFTQLLGAVHEGLFFCSLDIARRHL